MRRRAEVAPDGRLFPVPEQAKRRFVSRPGSFQGNPAGERSEPRRLTASPSARWRGSQTCAKVGICNGMHPPYGSFTRLDERSSRREKEG